MANSPTLCQKFVAKALEPTRQKYPSLYMIHYMDDILLAHSNESILLSAFSGLQADLQHCGLQIAPEKVQHSPPYSYLGFRLDGETFKAQKFELRKDNLKTLNDFQKLLGDINWICPYLKITTGELKPLFDILKGPSDPTLPRVLTDEGCQALNIVEKALTAQTINHSHCDYTKEWGLYILPSKHTPTAVLFQDSPLYWIHLPVSPAQVFTPYFGLVSNLVAKGRWDSRELLGRDPYFICLPFTKEQQNWLFQFSDSWNVALAHFASR